MAVVQGVKEKVHLPIYDSIKVEPKEQLRKDENSNTWKFFVNVQNKTILETNLQSASLLPHYNTFEARAMRVVISDIPPAFPDEAEMEDTEIEVLTDEDEALGVVSSGTDEGEVVVITDANEATVDEISASIELSIERVVSLLRQALDSEDGFASLSPGDDEVTLLAGGDELEDDQVEAVSEEGGMVWLSAGQLEGYLAELEEKAPPDEQVHPNNGSGSLIGKIIYNTVTTLYVGEKIMIQMPTWFFPAGAGPYAEGKAITHGEPSPTATFRFAEPIYVDRQQNFRVEIEIPDSEVLKELQQVYGPLFIWVVLDGYMTRDVQ